MRGGGWRRRWRAVTENLCFVLCVVRDGEEGGRRRRWLTERLYQPLPLQSRFYLYIVCDNAWNNVYLYMIFFCLASHVVL